MKDPNKTCGLLICKTKLESIDDLQLEFQAVNKTQDYVITLNQDYTIDSNKTLIFSKKGKLHTQLQGDANYKVVKLNDKAIRRK